MNIADKKMSIFWFLLTSILITIAFRWPATYHETGVDSFYVHGLANSIVDFGEIKWMINPLSLFGLYSMSYASGVPILLAEFSSMSGFTMEETILTFSALIAVISAITAFLLGLEIRNSAPFAFAVSIIYSACPILLFSTQWSIGARSMFLAILPITFWILVRLGKNAYKEFSARSKNGLYIMLVVTMFLMAFIHRLFFVMIIFLIAYFVAKRVYYYIGPQREYFISRIRRKKLMRLSMILVTTVIAAAFAVIISYYAGWLGLESYENGFFEGDSAIVKFLNLIAPIAATIGFPIAFIFPISLAVILKSKRKDFISVFFIASLLLILPFSGGRQYERWLYPLLLGALVLLPMYLIVSSKNRRNFAKVAAVALLLTLPLNLLIVDHYNKWPETRVINDGISTSDHGYMTALYYSTYFEGEFFTGNNGVTCSHIQAYSRCPEIPGDIIDLLIYNVINRDDIDAELNTIEEILSGKGTLFSTHWQEVVYTDWAILYLLNNGPSEAKDILNEYHTDVFIEDLRLDGKIFGYGGDNVYPRGPGAAPFIDGVHNATYKIYDNGIDVIWRIR